MGFYFRRSINFGPLRLNFSKSGIGVSAGVKGARISSGPRGTYVHAGRNGFYYSQRIGGQSAHRPEPPTLGQPSQSPPLDQQSSSPYVIKTADVSRLVETSSTELLNQINSNAAQMRSAPLAVLAALAVSGLVFALVLLFAAPVADFFVADRDFAISIGTFVAFIATSISLILGLSFSWRIHKGDELKRTTPLFYELEQNAQKKFHTIKQACEGLAASSRVWRVQTNQPIWDWKRNAGASALITRQPIFVGRQQPPYIATNVDVWSIKLNEMALFFMPDYLFIRQRGRYGAVSYDSLEVLFSPTRFIEDQIVPPDAQVVDYTWRFVNKKGGPDRRFNNNRQLPIAVYGFMQFQSGSGLNIHLNVSSVERAEHSAEAFHNSLHQRQPPSNPDKESSRPYNDRPGARQNKPLVDERIRSAHQILSIEIGSTAEQIVAAYRQMAKMYHPDRVANLAPEFIELAEERMKEINAAYEVLKRYIS